MLGPSPTHIEAILAQLDPSWAHVGPILADLGPMLGPCLGHVGPMLGPCSPYVGPMLRQSRRKGSFQKTSKTGDSRQKMGPSPPPAKAVPQIVMASAKTHPAPSVRADFSKLPMMVNNQ